jgi:hypothetical protein
MDFEDQNIFMVGGVMSNSESWLAAIGLYDYFWSLTPEVQQKMLLSWRDNLDLLIEDSDLLASADPAEAEGNLVVIVDKDVIEAREVADNVIQFPIK